ncbi:MAG: hypothetical protein FWG90_01970 [Oscillospiraceae bacterium]|nr:hypothetical protein [Oscillospiraceae bacterium]
MYQQPTDFKVEIYFDPNAANLPDICKATDDIFSALNMPCVESGSDRRFYSGNGDPMDIGLLCRGVGKVKRNPFILNFIIDGYFFNGVRRETLMTSFFKNSLGGLKRG